MDVYALTRQKRPKTLTLGNNPYHYTGPAAGQPAPTTPQPRTPSTLLPQSPLLARPAVLRHTESGRILGIVHCGGGKLVRNGDGVLTEALGNSESYSMVTGPPTRDHWKPDAEATVCTYPECQREFGLFERRHHCRRCGNIFCGAHCSRYVRLDQNAQYNTFGVASRACVECHDEYVTRFRLGIAVDKVPGGGGKSRDSGYHPGERSGENAMEGDGGYRQRRDSLQEGAIRIKGRPAVPAEVELGTPASVPLDWSWSTF